MQARSVIPGRQRWDIGIVLAGPRVAEFLEGRLRQTPGVEAVRANPITGRLLVHHDIALTSQGVEQLIRETVVLAVQEAVELIQSSGPIPSVVPARVRPRRRGAPGAVILALILGLGRFFFRRSPALPHGPIPAATMAVFRRTWGESLSFQQALLSSPLYLASISPSPLLFLVLSSRSLSPLPPSALSSLSFFSSSPLSFLFLSSSLFPAIPSPFRSSLSALSSFSSHPLLFLVSAPPELRQSRRLPSDPQRLLRDRHEDRE